jgi:hypothetical protein
VADAVALALITAGFTSAVAITGSVVAHSGTRRTLEARHEELQRTIQARHEEVHEERHEHRVEQRRETYHEFLNLLNRYDGLMTGYIALSVDAFHEWLGDYYDSLNALYLVAPKDVLNAARPVVEMIHELGGVYEPSKSESVLERHKRGYLDKRREFANAANKTTVSMRADVANDLGVPDDLKDIEFTSSHPADEEHFSSGSPRPAAAASNDGQTT